MNTTKTMALALALATLAGCSDDAYLVDDVDRSFSDAFSEAIGEIAVAAFSPFGADTSPEENQIHQPYVVGASVGFTLYDDDEVAAEWRLESAAPEVFSIDSQADGTAKCRAVAPGVATVRALDDDGDVIEEWSIEVAAPDAVVLAPYARELTGHSEPLASGDTAKVMVGSTSMFEVRYLRSGQRLWGQGILAASSADGDLGLTAGEASLDDRLDWIQVTPASAGTFTVDLSANGASLASASFEAVTEDAVASIELLDDARAGSASEGESLSVGAQAFDADGAPIYGVAGSWTLGGSELSGQGELFTYAFDPAVTKSLGVQVGEVDAEIPIHASQGNVAGSANLGCSAGGRAGSDASVLLAAVGLAIAGWRRRRAVRS